MQWCMCSKTEISIDLTKKIWQPRKSSCKVCYAGFLSSVERCCFEVRYPRYTIHIYNTIYMITNTCSWYIPEVIPDESEIIPCKFILFEMSTWKVCTKKRKYRLDGTQTWRKHIFEVNVKLITFNNLWEWCKQCLKRKFQVESGISRYIDSPPGTYQENTGSSSCEPWEDTWMMTPVHGYSSCNKPVLVNVINKRCISHSTANYIHLDLVTNFHSLSNSISVVFVDNRNEFLMKNIKTVSLVWWLWMLVGDHMLVETFFENGLVIEKSRVEMIISEPF